MKRKYIQRTSRRCLTWSTAYLGMLALCASTTAFAQSAIPTGKFNAWLHEKPVPEAPLYRARMAGVASYKTYHANATMAFNCRTDSAHVSAELTFDPKVLGFDTDPYEGPDATASGPITVTSGNDAPVRIKVGGWFGDGGPFDTGTPFLFGFSLDDALVRHWTADTTRGHNLRIEVPAAKGGGSMTVAFRWPDDDAVFKQVVLPCLGKPTAH
ncbi:MULTISPECIES: hypothetical protein [unclassified Dyella]|uniref:hypothetical protein n=1 Tax=unclassified Dyella TaxID=2634549 RepID=UPI000CB80E75|nr:MULTISPECIES: hypothetical protein [unclassified Dyella]MDR3443893.1 hypothetical protein [Dyella sp.]PMQ05166.1 hypothetical protein DyAD56_10870 [Dyella sp. AD56]